MTFVALDPLIMAISAPMTALVADRSIYSSSLKLVPTNIKNVTVMMNIMLDFEFLTK